MVLEQEHGNVLTKSWLSKNKSQRWNRAHHLGYGACGGKNFLIVHETSLLQQDVDPGKILPGMETRKEGNWHTLPGFKTLETQENVCSRSCGWMEAGSFSNTLHHSHLSGREQVLFHVVNPFVSAAGLGEGSCFLCSADVGAWSTGGSGHCAEFSPW